MFYYVFYFFGFLLGVNNDNSSPVKDIVFWDQYNDTCISGDKENAYKDILSNYLHDYFYTMKGRLMGLWIEDFAMVKMSV